MGELRSILKACDSARATGRVAVLATIVRAVGSTYRGPGARMLVRDDGTCVGLVSGGCLEADLAERAREVLLSGESRTVVYDHRSPDDLVWGLGLGCSGEVRVLLERLEPERPMRHLEFLQSCLDRRARCAVAVAFAVDGRLPVRLGDRWLVDAAGALVDARDPSETTTWVLEEARTTLAERRSRVRSQRSQAGRLDVLFEHVAPSIALVVFGAGSDAVPLVRLAAALGWDVTVTDPRPALARPDRFPEARRVELLDLDRIEECVPLIDERTPCVVLTHNFVHDRRILEHLVGSRAPYVGLLGPRKRAENLLRAIGVPGGEVREAHGGRIHGPAGVDIGAETSEEIALSIVAEVHARIEGRGAGFLRDRGGPLHHGRAVE